MHICKDEPGMPDNIQTRVKLMGSGRPSKTPSEFIVLDELRTIADMMEQRLYPDLHKKFHEKETTVATERDYYCPLCGAENPEKIYEVPGQGAVGCDECLCAYEPWEYFENREVIG
jgi:hypothetical protein